MRYLFMLLIILAACRSPNQKETPAPARGSETDTLPNLSVNPGAFIVNRMLDSLGVAGRVTTDSISGWTKDALEYFVYPQRKEEPDYPYIIRGDFNCDEKEDIAALISDSSGNTRLAFLYRNPLRIDWWKEDVRGAALRTFSQREFGAMAADDRELRVKLDCDAVEAVWFEKATQVIYREKNEWRRVWTAD